MPRYLAPRLLEPINNHHYRCLCFPHHCEGDESRESCGRNLRLRRNRLVGTSFHGV